MKKSQIKIGMKVVPFRKSVDGYARLRESHQVEVAKKMGQPFLYVTERNEDEHCWCLSVSNVPNTHVADFFNSWDFVPYVESWIDFIVEPSPAELAQMNQSALELEAQFSGEEK